MSVMLIFWFLPGWARVVRIVKNVNDSTDSIVKIIETTDQTLTYFRWLQSICILLQKS